MTMESITKRLLASDNLSFWITDPVFFTLVWVGIMVLVIICPFIATRQRRTLCYRRITERTWNVEGIEVPSVLPNSRIFERTYPVGDPRRRYTKEDADNETEKFIREKLAPFTKTIDENDFIKNEDDVEMGQNDHSLARKQSFENLTKVTMNTSRHSLNKESQKSLVTNPPSANDVVDQEPMTEEEDEKKETQEDETKSVTSHDGTEKLRTIMLPGPGIPFHDGNCSSCTNSALGDVERQCLSTECSICLGAFSVGEKVSWSALDCKHAFHQECIVEWLMTLGKKNNRVAENSNNNTIMQIRLCDYSMVCPVCRKDFIPKATSSS